jgi:hypothetical protein
MKTFKNQIKLALKKLQGKPLIGVSDDKKVL